MPIGIVRVVRQCSNPLKHIRAANSVTKKDEEEDNNWLLYFVPTCQLSSIVHHHDMALTYIEHGKLQDLLRNAVNFATYSTTMVSSVFIQLSKQVIIPKHFIFKLVIKSRGCGQAWNRLVPCSFSVYCHFPLLVAVRVQAFLPLEN